MLRMSRRSGIVLLGLCTALSGCLNRESAMPTSNGYATTTRQTVYPNGSVVQGPYGKGPDNMIRQASFGQPGKPDESVEGNLGQPRVMPDGTVVQDATMPGGMLMPPRPLPTEKDMTTHAPHRVAPPDILLIEALRIVPKGPYKLEPMEILQIEVSDTLPKQEIKGLYMISPEGKINLGHTYGFVRVGGLTVEEIQIAIRNHLQPIIKSANVNVALAQVRGMQNVKGEHLVRPDGTIHLGMYGSVFVAGMTLGQVKCVIENHLSAYLIDPQVSVDVFAYNSRKIYIIADGAGYGQQVIALPATGGETVLDAISRVQGLPQVASLKKIWVARPAPRGHPCSQVLPVDWKAITQAGNTDTNYQLLPGDRIYISSNALIAFYNYLDMAIAPIERVLGVTLLGSSTIQSLRGQNTGVIVAR